LFDTRIVAPWTVLLISVVPMFPTAVSRKNRVSAPNAQTGFWSMVSEPVRLPKVAPE
jgi:hypothetical protein